MRLKKDEILNALADRGNVAQFVAFRPGTDGGPKQTYCRIAGREANIEFATLEEAITSLFESAPEDAVNIRSYQPESPRSREFIYALKSVDDVLSALDRLTAEGLHSIVNETIDVSDGGVSGVAQGNLIEFAPDDTPRCVEKPGTASLPFDLAMRLLNVVYGFAPKIAQTKGRLEFSIHPRPRGTRSEHTLLWEYEEEVPGGQFATATMAWPNRFSRHIGDKAYGLLMGWLLRQPIPATTVIGRKVAPFSFGLETGSFENWIRTCPVEPEPGLFTTARGWLDPFELLNKEDANGKHIASVLCQRSVNARFAGAALSGPKGLIVEGAVGQGDKFMLGVTPPQKLPQLVLDSIVERNDEIASILGPVRFEWVHDGDRLWIVQLHRGETASSGSTIVPGDVQSWISFEVSHGLEALRQLTTTIPSNHGIELIGQVGLTSHIADIVRRAGIPTRICPETQ